MDGGYGTEVQFISGAAKGTASMAFRANNAHQTTQVSVMSGGSPVASSPVQAGQFASILPRSSTLTTHTQVPIAANCGLQAVGYGQHRIWNSFILNTGQFFTWGNQEFASSGSVGQEACPPSGGGGGGGGYEDPGDCEICQQGFYYVDGELIDEWWDCYNVSCTNVE